MNCLEERIELDGHSLQRYIFFPGEKKSIRGALIHFHGQGDFSERYQEILHPFLRKGIACVATDLPGHGRSSGVRGRVPGLEVVDRIAETSQQRCLELCTDRHLPLGIVGHSVGGLLALREILRRPSPYSFSWISSPLLNPAANQNSLLVRLAPLAARLLPGLTMATGVSRDKCTSQPPPPGEPDGPDLFHRRVSLRWGYALIKVARWVEERFRTSPPQIPLLFTQGLRDQVCAPRDLHDLLRDAAPPLLTLREFPEALHEPFSDQCREQVFCELTNWLEDESIA